MLQARRRFLDKGYYSELAELVCDQISNSSSEIKLLDVGCGEGYYSGYIHKKYKEIVIAGMDISKPAVRMCAKKNRDGHFAVASAFDLPYESDQFDIALSVFSPINLEEIARVLKPGATLFMVGPGPSHLRSLAQIVYREAQAHKGNPQSQQPDELRKTDLQCLQTSIDVDGADLIDLLMMTPYFWSCSEENKSKLSSLDGLSIELDFELSVFKKAS